MHKVRYEFTRSNTITGITSSNRANTDAFNTLEVWQTKPARSYEIVEDEDEFLVADLAFLEGDKNAGTDLDSASQKSGVNRTFVCNL